MFYLMQFHWVWLLLSVLLGSAIGWTTCTTQNDDRYRSWISAAAVAFLVGLILALLRLLPGRLGYFLDMALLMFAFYIIGCCIGCWSKGRLAPDPAAVTPTPAKAGSGLATDQRQASARVSPGAEGVVGAPAAVGSAGAIRAQIPGLKPATLSAPINGVKDDLKLIRGVGPTNENALNRLGVFHFSQIAQWQPEEVTWVSHSLAFPGRIERERWVDQAQILNRGQDTVFAKHVKSGSAKADDAPLSDSAVAALRADLAMVPEAPTGVAPSASAPVAAIKTQPVAPSVQSTAGAVAQTSPTVPSDTTSPASSSQNGAAAAPARAQTDPIKPERIDAADAQTAGAEHPGSKPVGLAAPTGGTKDDLKRIKGIGPKNEMVLNDLGIFHFGQIADWTAAEAMWTGHHMAFPGRIEREHWIDQAKILCKGGATEHSQAVQSGRVTPDDAPLVDVDQLTVKLTEPLVQPAAEHPGSKPVGLAAPTGGAKDDLKLIKGIGPNNEKALNDLGIFHFGQIADWTPQEALWTGHHMAFPGRIEREHWIDQAKLLSAGVDTEHAKAVREGAVAPHDRPLSVEEASQLKSGLPKQIESVASEDKYQGRRPLGLTERRRGPADDLKRIKGIGPQNEGRLHALGIWHFDQIAGWSTDNVRWVGSYLAFPGRIDREQWVAQAKALATGADISKGVKRDRAKRKQ